MHADGPPHPGGPLASGTDTAGESRDAMPPRRLRLDLSYDGSDFRGFAENRDVDTVGGRLRGALEQMLRHPVTLTCAGRTDAGVHARGQVVTVDTTAAVDPVRLRDSLNGMVGPKIVVSGIRLVDDTFDARFSARSRTYRYTVLNREVPDPFRAGTAWWVPAPLDVAAMDLAAVDLVGEHDFSSFCRRPRAAGSGMAARAAGRRCRWCDGSSAPTGWHRPTSPACWSSALARPRSVTRWSAASWVCWSTSAAGTARRATLPPRSRPGTAPGRGSWPRPTAWSCGRSATDGRACWGSQWASTLTRRPEQSRSGMSRPPDGRRER